jgi:hypothetical protein
MKILMTPEGKKVQVNMSEDKCLYDAPEAYLLEEKTRISLYYHKARSSKGYYYTYHWSDEWLGSGSSCELITEDQAKDFILERAFSGSRYVSGRVNESKCCELWGKDFFEDA